MVARELADVQVVGSEELGLDQVRLQVALERVGAGHDLPDVRGHEAGHLLAGLAVHHHDEVGHERAGRALHGGGVGVDAELGVEAGIEDELFQGTLRGQKRRRQIFESILQFS